MQSHHLDYPPDGAVATIGPLLPSPFEYYVVKLPYSFSVLEVVYGVHKVLYQFGRNLVYEESWRRRMSWF